MISAAVTRSLRVLRIRPSGLSAVSSCGEPAISGITETPVSKPLNPSASLGNKIAAASVICRQSPCAYRASRHWGNKMGWDAISKSARRSTTALSSR